MKVLLGCLLTAFLVNIYCCSFAQTSYAVTGKVTTDNGAVAEGTTITLLQYPDSSIIKSTICTANGRFGFEHIKPGSYFVLAHKVGFQRLYSGRYRVEDKAIDILITLHALTAELKEVTVTDKRDYIEVHPGKTVLNVDRSIFSAGNSVLDVLSTAPGVRVIDNQVLLKGGQKALIAIDGKPIGQLNDEQLTELLKSYSSGMISQIEIIPNPSAKFDAAGGGVINIILKKSKDVGFKANITESAAVGQDYKLNSSINLNYRTEKLNFFGSYSFADNKLPRMLDVDRVIGDNEYDVNYNSTTYTKNHSFNFGTDYSISPKQTVGALIYGYHNQAGIDKANVTDIETNEQLDSNITTKSHIDRSTTNLNYNLNYRGSFGKADNTTLSADFDYSTYKRRSMELLQNNFYTANGLQYQDPFLYIDNSPSKINVRSEKIDFTQALSKTGVLGIGLKNNQVHSNNMIDFKGKVDTAQQYVPVAVLTDHFIYNESINAGYVTYNDKFKNTSVALGLRAEQTKSFSESLNPNKTVDRSYFNLFPNIQIIQSLDKDNQFTIGYNRRILRPNYQDLNPFVAYIDQYSYSTGNTFLKPEYINNYGISDIYKDKYQLSLNMIVTRDFFVPIFQQNDSSKVYTSTVSNIGTRYEYNADFTVPIDITKWWKINLSLFGSYERFVYNLDSARKTTTDFEIELSQKFAIAKGLNAEVFTSWESPTYYGIKQYNTQWEARAAISQTILHGDGSIRLMVTDIFNTDGYEYTSHYTNLNLSGSEKSGSRFLQATFTYRFGKQSVKNTEKRDGGNTDEQKRLNGSANEN